MKEDQSLAFILAEKINQVEGLQLDYNGIVNNTLFLTINGHKYGYEAASPDLPVEEIERKFKQMVTFSPGKALAWLKSVTKLASGSVRGMFRVDPRRWEAFWSNLKESKGTVMVGGIEFNLDTLDYAELDPPDKLMRDNNISPSEILDIINAIKGGKTLVVPDDDKLMYVGGDWISQLGKNKSVVWDDESKSASIILAYRVFDGPLKQYLR